MQTLKIILIIYGILCLYVGILKPPFIWHMKKFDVLKKIFKGERNVQIFVIVWGLIALIIGLYI
ncbi:MAG: hypothetical protein K9L26_03445 [Candidatus Izimaplasma sp.]|nr:hypothetical protein [Candidatus Izimaplasma bacterium]